MLRAVLALCAVAAVAAVCAARADSPPATPLYDPKTLPAGAVGASIRYGHDIVDDTLQTMKGNVTAQMNCSACHLAAGTQAHGGSFVGTYAYFPQWNKRSHRVIALQDRITECFLYSMNGRPPSYSSPQMVAIVAYIAWLSRGTPTLATPDPATGFKVPLPAQSPDLVSGAALYAQKCSACHGAGGAGVAGTFPPLWGAASFNDGAGMAHIDRMTGFVKYNMPQNAPGTLSLQQAYDIAGFVLSHKRPAFNGHASVTSSPLPADYF